MRFNRLRRLRRDERIRNLVSQTELRTKDLIQPYFVARGVNKKEAIESMPGIYRLSADNLVEDIGEAERLGIKAVLLFGMSNKKDGIPTLAKWAAICAPIVPAPITAAFWILSMF